MTPVETCKKWIIANLEPTTRHSTSPVSPKAYTDLVNFDLKAAVTADDFTAAMLEIGFEMSEPDGYHRTYPTFKCKYQPAYRDKVMRRGKYNRYYITPSGATRLVLEKKARDLTYE